MVTLEINTCDDCSYWQWYNPHGLDDQVTRICNHPQQENRSVTTKIKNAQRVIVNPGPLSRDN